MELLFWVITLMVAQKIACTSRRKQQKITVSANIHSRKTRVFYLKTFLVPQTATLLNFSYWICIVFDKDRIDKRIKRRKKMGRQT